MLFAYMARESYTQSARHAASHFAGIDATGKDENFLAMMTRYRSYREVHHRKDSYEQTQILSGEREQDYDIPPEEENYWDFGSAAVEENSDHWKRYIDATKKYGRARVVLTWAVGGLILGRVLSMIHTLHLYRTSSVKGLLDTKIPDEGKDAVSHNESGTDNTISLRWSVVPLVLPDQAGVQFVLQF